METIAILGGTGDQGLGLALRFARAGRGVAIGSRKADRALAAAEEVRGQVPGAAVEGFENPEATSRGRIVVLSVSTIGSRYDCQSASGWSGTDV